MLQEAAEKRSEKGPEDMQYGETFNDNAGGWHGWISNAAGPKPLEIKNSCAISRSPWWIDYNHAPPGRKAGS